MFDARVAPTPKDTVHRDGKASLYRFRRTDGRERAAGTHVPVLLVPSMINRWYVMDLREGASVAAALSADAPWDTYLLDWGIPEDEDRYLDWEAVLARLARATRRVRRESGARSASPTGHGAHPQPLLVFRKGQPRIRQLR